MKSTTLQNDFLQCNTKHILQKLNQYIVFCELVNRMIFTSFCSKNSSLPHPFLKSCVNKYSVNVSWTYFSELKMFMSVNEKKMKKVCKKL